MNIRRPLHRLLRPRLSVSVLQFALQAETAHELTIAALAQLSRSRGLCALLGRRRPILPRKVMGIDFPNPVGLAAGLDKNARAANALHAFGFGWLELGTVTPLSQPGNPKPRLFRLPEHRALINRMGFNNIGLARFVKNLARIDRSIVKGVNIGKNAATALDRSVDDYLAGIEAVHRHADYVAINISSPNTDRLRDLHRADALAPFLSAIDQKRIALADKCGSRTPLVLKIAPDLTTNALDQIADLARQFHIDAIAATNTTPARSGIENHPLAAQVGGLSGPPLTAAATDTIRRLHANLQGEIPLIGIGGIDSPQDAVEKFQAGAELVQIYTGFIYRGAGLVRGIVEAVGDLHGLCDNSRPENRHEIGEIG